MPLDVRLPGPPSPPPERNDFGAGTPPHGSAGSGRTRVVGIVLLLVVVVVGGVVLQARASSETKPTPETTEVTLAAPRQAQLGACVDRSYGLHRLGTDALRAVTRSVSAYGAWTRPVPRSRPVDPVPGLLVRARVVRPDSYVGTDPLNTGVTVDLPSTPGLATAEPALGSPADVVDAYESAHAKLDTAVAQSLRARNAAARTLRPLRDVVSEGSDVTGCLFGLVRDSGGAPLSALVVSDFWDTGLTHPDGTPREFAGDLSRLRLTVVTACTDSDPGRCERRYQAFLDRVRGFGLDVEHVVRRGPGQVGDAVDRWFATGLQQVAP